MTPRLTPFAMLNVSGIAMIVRKAGSASLMSSHVTCTTPSSIMAPTRIRAGAVAAAGMAAASGQRNMLSRNSTPTVTAVRPVRPPSPMPLALST